MVTPKHLGDLIAKAFNSRSHDLLPASHNKIYELRARALRWLASSALRTKDALLTQPGGWFRARRAGAPGKFLRLNTRLHKQNRLYVLRRKNFS